MLSTAGLDELVSRSALQYEERALELAADPVRLGQLRSKLSLKDASIFDTERYTRNLEAVYQTIYQRHHAGLPPAHISEHLAT